MIIVITPTYNERENLPLLVKKLFALSLKHLHLMVVDDASPDGTAEVANELARFYPMQVFHRRKKEGLGRAYCDAFRYVLSSFPQATHIIQMDADGSHDPEAIPRMLQVAQEADLVLGSRYIAGGGVANWHWSRKMVSWLGNIYARNVLWLPYHDLTGGFKCWKRETLAAIDLADINSIGYNFQIEMTWRAHKQGYRISEIPIIFTERKAGESKFNLAIMLESFWNVLKMRFDGMRFGRK